MTDYIVLDHMHRDAIKFMAFGALLRTRNVTKVVQTRLVSELAGGELFVAEKVGIPAQQEELWVFSDDPPENDHVWHSFNLFRLPRGEDANLPVWGSVSDLIKRFEKIDSWNEALLPHWDI